MTPEARHGVRDALLFHLGEFGLEPRLGLFGLILFRGGFALPGDFGGRGAVLLEFLNCFRISAFGGAGVTFEFVEGAALVDGFEDETIGGFGVELVGLFLGVESRRVVRGLC